MASLLRRPPEPARLEIVGAAGVLTLAASAGDAAHFREILRIADRMSPRLRAAFIRTVEELRAKIPEQRLAVAFESGRIEAVLETLALEDMGKMLLPRVSVPLARVTETVGEVATAALAKRIGAALEWGKLSRRARAWVKQHGADLVKEVSDATREAIRETIRDVFGAQKLTTSQATRLIRQTVGLAPPQAKALSGFTAELVDRGIPDKEIRRLAGIYERRLLRYRAENIARTETVQAASASQRELWAEGEAQGHWQRGEYVREWQAILRDGRICQECYEAHGQRAPLGKPYPNGTMGPTLHTRCRCGERLVEPDDPQPAKPPFVEPEDGGGLRPMLPKV